MPRLKAVAPPPPVVPAARVAESRSPIWWLRYVPVVLIGILLIDLVYLAGQVAIVPVLASFALAYVLSPVVTWLEKRGLSRSLAALLALLLVSLGLVMFLWFVIPDLWEQSVLAGEKIAGFFTKENADRQRAQLRRFSPMLDRMVSTLR